MVDLPNDSWVRSTKKPEYAICLDKDNRFFGWKMFENYDNWISVGKLTQEEILKMFDFPDFKNFHDNLAELLKPEDYEKS